ncbi:MAG TPA: hypothetical protein VLQ65_03710 [Saliniramus sp.]|nr:hypothetical protein [Saliniramus sp.]
MIRTQNASLTDFLPSPGRGIGRPSFAELTAHLSECLGIPVDDLELVLSVSEPHSLAIYLAGDHAAAVKLRSALGLDPEKITTESIAEALAQPQGRICAALFDALDRMSGITLDPEAVLVARLRHVKRALLAGWKRALAYAAPTGYLTLDDAYCIGIGETVYGAMLAQCGKARIEALSSEEFLQLAPKLIEFWPISDEGLSVLSNLLWETEAYIETHLDAEFAELTVAVGSRG